MGSEQNRFPQQERRKKWGGCWGGLPCFGVQKSNKRIVPANRGSDGNTTANQPNGPQGGPNQANSLAPHLLAPPSSPASFTNSALPSTAQSPNNCHLSLSANSPGGPSSSMFATGPYANETQLVTPPVFSTFTTQPSTAPLTPPPELAHLTTPSSPDVPFAQFLSSGKISYMGSNDLQATYPYSPRSPASCLRSPVSSTPGDCASPWDPNSPKTGNYPRNTNGVKSHDSNFFCPSTFAQFYLDQPHSVGRLSVSKESDVYPNGGTTVSQSKPSKSSKQDVEEVEAYRASFGFSADEMITTSNYVEISDVMDDSFTMNPYTSTKAHVEETALLGWGHGGSRSRKSENYAKSGADYSDIHRVDLQKINSSIRSEDEKSEDRHGNISSQSTPRNLVMTDDEDIFSGLGKQRKNRKFHMGQSCSDAEIEYRRGRSLRKYREDLSWH